MQDKRKELISKLTGLTDFSEESLANERGRIQNELEELDPTIKERREEFERLHGHKTKEEQVKISLNNTFEGLYEMFKDMFMEGRTNSAGVLSINSLDVFYRVFNLVLKSATNVSLGVKLNTIREVRAKVLMSLSQAKEMIKGEEIGLYKQEEFNPPKRQSYLDNAENMGNYFGYRLKFIQQPLFLAKKNIDIYEDIIKTLQHEEEMILIELRNGKSLDYSPIDSKKDNSNPTTSATEEDSKRDRKLSMREIALIYWYDRDNLIFSKSTAQQIAELYGHTSKSSGLSLYKDHYLQVSKDEKQRTHNETSVQYLNNMIPTLTTERGKREANEDLKKAHEFKEQKKNKLF